MNHIETHEWTEHHYNGNVWISGKIGIVPESLKHLYDCRTNFKGFEGKYVCRLGLWTKHYSNNQLAWTLDYGDGTHEYKGKEIFPSYRKDGTIIVN
ncbi:MAG: hypothetical protein WAT79_08430 [Saprospiraceae bacterium]